MLRAVPEDKRSIPEERTAVKKLSIDLRNDLGINARDTEMGCGVWGFLY